MIPTIMHVPKTYTLYVTVTNSIFVYTTHNPSNHMLEVYFMCFGNHDYVYIFYCDVVYIFNRTNQLDHENFSVHFHVEHKFI